MGQALVTGGSRGIGLALAAELARAGHEVVITGRDPRALERAASGTGARAHALDSSDTGALVRALRALDDAAPLDLVIANAGVGAARGVLSDPDQAPGAPSEREPAPYSWEAIEAAFHTNFCGAAATLTAVLPRMVRRGRGHLVGISSLAAFGPLPGSAAYCAPKAGLDMFLSCLELDLAGTGVAVTRVSLGFVRTRMVEHSAHPMPQLLEPDWVAREIVRRLPSRPTSITLPRALAVAARALAALPPSLKTRPRRLR